MIVFTHCGLSEFLFLFLTAEQKWLLLATLPSTQENIEWFIEDQAFSSFYGLAPPPPLALPLPSVSSTGDTQEEWEREMGKRGMRWGVGGGAKSYMTARKLVPLYINHYILSGLHGVKPTFVTLTLRLEFYIAVVLLRDTGNINVHKRWCFRAIWYTEHRDVFEWISHPPPLPLPFPVVLIVMPFKLLLFKPVSVIFSLKELY